MARQEICDVIIIGGGSAAFEAAVAARQAGAEKVIMLEKSPIEQFGGNARHSHTGFRCVYKDADDIRRIVRNIDEESLSQFHLPGYSSDDFVNDLNRVTENRIDQELARLIADESLEAVCWMGDLGIKFEPEKHIPINGRYFFEPGIIVHTEGGGLGQVMKWKELGEEWDVDFRCDAKVVGFIGDHRKVEGVTVASGDENYELKGGALIVCAGGFQANSEMRARYLGPNADLMKVRGSIYDTGEVLNMLLEIGAKATGHWQGAHATPIDANAKDGAIPLREDGHGNSANRYDYMFGITINSLGQRFYDEGESNHSYTYAKTGRAVLAQPAGVGFQIYDQKGISLFRLGAEYTDTYQEAGTLTELASKIGMQVEILNHTVENFNAACSKDVDFDPTRLDGKSTRNISPPKSNWAEPLTEPPFRAYPITCGITFSFGGVGINTDCQVINNSNVPIEGLYASGDIVGLFFHNYPSCTGQTRNAVFSYKAGQNAAKYAATV